MLVSPGGIRIRLVAVVTLVTFVASACTGDAGDETRSTSDPTPTAPSDADSGDGAVAATSPDADADADAPPAEPLIGPAADHAEVVGVLASLLPDDAHSVVVFDLERLLGSASSGQVEALLDGSAGDPALGQTFGVVGRLAASIDRDQLSTAVVTQATDAADGFVLLARVGGETVAEISSGALPAPDGTYGDADWPMYVDDGGHHLTVLPGGVLVAGDRTAVESVLDVAAGVVDRHTGALGPFIDALDPAAHVTFAYGLPALFDDELTPDRSLRSASVVSGAYDIGDGEYGGTMAFHTSNAAEFVETYNRLDRNATQGENPSEQPLRLGDPIADGLAQVVVTIPPTPIDPSPAEQLASRNLFKKLFVGMEAHDYAEQVAARAEGAWLDFLVDSEAGEPPSAGSVYIRWEFKDEAAIDAFEANELPAGFRLAPTQFLESDDPDGEYFFALNLYNAGGGSIVSGTRAEWDVFVHPPDGADPNAGVRPRFGVVDVLAEEVSADSGNLLTLAEPLSHEIVDGVVVSDVRRFDEDGNEVPAFESTFPVPDPATAEVARFTREMAIGNDYIYWAHGVSDRVLYNATTFNFDAYLVDVDQMTFTDSTRWAQYLKPEIKDAVYYVNSLEYVASPMTNLDSEYLDITPEWRKALVAFTTNGHQEGLMRKGVEQLFRGAADALVGFDITNETPSTFFHFEITDPDGLEAAIDLPDGHRLVPTALFADGPEEHHLLLSVFEVDGAIEGTRAEWRVFTDDGSGRPHLTVIELMTEDVAFDPVTVVNLPDEVSHELTDGVLTTRLSSPTTEFEASFDTADVTHHELSLDWIEAGDNVCTINGVCDRYYYDAETLDVPVHQPAGIDVASFSSPWSEFVNATPSVVFYRDNFQEYVVGRWHDLDVPVEALPFTGLENRTHEITGGGSLVGRTSPVGDSTYTYTGDAVVDGEQVTFSIDQEVVNALGVGNIFTTGEFDLATGNGTQTVVDCQGPALLCSDITPGSTAFYTAQQLDVDGAGSITWQVDVAVDLGGAFGIADSASTFAATPLG